VRRSPCLGWGRGGVGYVLYRAGRDRRSRPLLDRAARWAAAGVRSALPFQLRGWPRTSYSRGLAGLYALTAMIAEARGDATARERAIVRFLEINHRARGTIDLFSGTAGRLAGVAILHRRCPDPRLVALGDRMAAGLIPRLARREQRLVSNGLAHGWPGVALGLLAWHRVSPTVPPAALHAALEALHDHAPDGPGWAHGHAGTAMLWARAHAQLGDRRYLAWARAAGETAFATSAGGFELMVGAPGTAFGLLAVADVDPSGSWRERAWILAARAIGGLIVPDADPYGLWGGLSGLYCLADDLARGGPAEFPIIDA